jgi:hypothetical protein
VKRCTEILTCYQFRWIANNLICVTWKKLHCKHWRHSAIFFYQFLLLKSVTCITSNCWMYSKKVSKGNYFYSSLTSNLHNCVFFWQQKRRYLIYHTRHVSEITFIRYDKSQKIGKPNKIYKIGNGHMRQENLIFNNTYII